MIHVVRRYALRWVGAAMLLSAASYHSNAAPLLILSVDGMKPEYVLQAESRGLKLPFLRSLMADGVYADGVVGVWPTVTYPSHTTLVTGVSPAEHGIFGNLEFDPGHHFDGAWFWYAPAIRVPALWEAAHAAGLRTASVGWPVTVGAAGIDYLIPEYWRIDGATDELNPSDRYLMAAVSRPLGLLAELQPSAGPYMMGNDTTRNGDEIKTRYAVEILRQHKPAFMTVHLSSLDDAEHAYGVFSPEADQDLEAIDAMLQRLADAARAADPATVVAVVSDHGFTPVTHKVNLYVPFVKAGLITVAPATEGKTPRITSWRAQPWFAGGMAAIMLKDPDDRQTERIVQELLQKLASDPQNGIASIRDRRAAKALGGFPDAAFIVDFSAGYYAGDNMTGELITEIPGSHGGHGFSPELPAMRAAFFVAGSGIARHRDLGVINMLQIAPTMAQVLGVTLPTARAAPLNLAP